jgi:hypothetical protein
VDLCKSLGVPAYARVDARDNQELAATVSIPDGLLNGKYWAESRRLARPQWNSTRLEKLQASFAAACLVRCGVESPPS